MVVNYYEVDYLMCVCSVLLFIVSAVEIALSTLAFFCVMMLNGLVGNATETILPPLKSGVCVHTVRK